MYKSLEISIKNARSYFLLRLFIHLLIKVNWLATLTRFFVRNHPKLSIHDVEQIFYIFDCEREAENIFLIKQIKRSFELNEIFDIGSNYGQFINKLAGEFQIGTCLDANPEAVSYLSETSSLKMFNLIHGAIVPSDYTNNKVVLKIPKGNTGAAHIGDMVDANFDEVIVDSISVKELVERYGDTRLNKFVKFDIEGLEPELVADYLELDRPDKDVIAFEILTHESKIKLDQVFKGVKQKFKFVTIRYSFLHESGIMGKNKTELLKMFLTGRATIDLYVVENVIDLDFEFMSLVFALPNNGSVENFFKNLKNIKEVLL